MPQALKIAGKHGTVRSFDLNYRSKVEPDKNRARRINKEIMHHVDMVVGNHDDFSDALGYPVCGGFEIRETVYPLLTCHVISVMRRTRRHPTAPLTNGSLLTRVPRLSMIEISIHVGINIILHHSTLLHIFIPI